MEVIVPWSESGQILCSIAVGKKYLDNWTKLSMSSWVDYCKRNSIGLVMVTQDLCASEGVDWKKPNWQKLLLGSSLSKLSSEITDVCYLDTNIMINRFSPNIFDSYSARGNYALVSLRNNLPFPYKSVCRRIAWLRRHHYKTTYPLDSALHISIEDLYKYHGLDPQLDEACTGLVVFNVKSHSVEMREWFNKYSKDVHSVTNDGEQTHLNYEIQNTGKVQWLDYRFQAIWNFEMAYFYPFLYNENNQRN